VATGLRTIDWDDFESAVVVIDQTALPDSLEHLHLTKVDDLVDAIQRLVVRGAPALGGAGALGVALAVRQAEREGHDEVWLDQAIKDVRNARPTAANLAWGVDRARAKLADGPDAVVAEACAVLDEDGAANRALGRRGAELLQQLCPDAGRFRIQTHCNAGGLACVEWGTALGVVRALHREGHLARVYASETRPLLQGARLTAWELEQMGVDYRLVVDGAGPSIIARGEVDAVVVGADRVAANGDVANKIGTFPLALAAAHAGVPFIVAAPEATIDAGTETGDAIEIEDRGSDEIVALNGVRMAPPGARGFNPAFDVTPADLVTALVTEARVVRPSLEALVDGPRPL
jgi:S-methyl-5-thioribose-1-phosphate isomerase